MMTKLLLEVLCALLMVFVAYGDGQEDNEYLQNSVEQAPCDKTRKIACVCGIGESKRILTVQQEIDPDNSEQDYYGCPVFPSPYEFCANYNCVSAENQSLGVPSPDGSIWKRNIIDSMYPQVFTIPAGYDGHRYARQAEVCQIPALKKGSITCWKWKNWMNCDITCIPGYALFDQRESKSRVNINCRNSENIWKPHGFVDCEAYLNCKAHLTKPGSLKCKEPVHGPAYCEISCLAYDQFDATPRQKYECVDENFEKSLPHCASLRDIELVRRPKE